MKQRCAYISLFAVIVQNSNLLTTLKRINILTLFISLVSIVLIYSEVKGWTNILIDEEATFSYILGLSIPLFLLFLGYVELRKTKIFVIWLMLGISMILFYMYFKDVASLQMNKGSALRSFKSLGVFLITFQVCRVIVRKWTKREYVTPTVMGSDLLEAKTPQLPDFIAFALLWVSIIMAQDI